MLASVSAGPITVEGYSLGGVYTTVGVPELGVLFDIGLGLRRFVGIDHLFISHAHADHIGGLARSSIVMRPSSSRCARC